LFRRRESIKRLARVSFPQGCEDQEVQPADFLAAAKFRAAGCQEAGNFQRRSQSEGIKSVRYANDSTAFASANDSSAFASTNDLTAFANANDASRRKLYFSSSPRRNS
jgi:hypothetical protein